MALYSADPISIASLLMICQLLCWSALGKLLRIDTQLQTPCKKLSGVDPGGCACLTECV